MSKMPNWRSDDAIEAEKAVETTDDVKKLKKIALKSPAYTARLGAISKLAELGEEKALHEILRKGDAGVRVYAREALDEMLALKRVSEMDGTKKSQSELARIACDESEKLTVREKAASMVYDETIATRYILSSSKGGRILVSHLSSNARLSTIAVSAIDFQTRREALEKLPPELAEKLVSCGKAPSDPRVCDHEWERVSFDGFIELEKTAYCRDGNWAVRGRTYYICPRCGAGADCSQELEFNYCGTGSGKSEKYLI